MRASVGESAEWTAIVNAAEENGALQNSPWKDNFFVSCMALVQ
jgi:hypothetical protein